MIFDRLKCLIGIHDYKEGCEQGRFYRECQRCRQIQVMSPMGFVTTGKGMSPKEVETHARENSLCLEETICELRGEGATDENIAEYRYRFETPLCEQLKELKRQRSLEL